MSTDPFENYQEEYSEQPPQEPHPARSKTAWILPVVTCVLLGTGLLIVGLGLGSTVAANSEAQSREDMWANVSLPQLPDKAEETDGEESSTAVSELVDPEWVTRTAEDTHIPEQILAAYAGSALLADQSFEQCNLGWNTLAAIGDVETEHGSYGGARVGSDGVVFPRILGPQLDGSSGLAEIKDTDNGELDNDTTYDRAVGPLQFLPATWEEYAQDGSGDGTADVNNIEDAAYSAAVYLCSNGDMSVESDWIDAISAYNPSADYNNEVAERAEHYGSFG